MRCDRAVMLLATGGPIGHWRARCHAARCARCAAEAARLGRIARELAAVEPLSAARRAVWTSMSTEPRPEFRPLQYRPALLAGAAAAAVLVIALGVAIMASRPPPVPGPPISDVGSPLPQTGEVNRAATIRELDDLKSDFQSLSQELTRLRRRAELLDERKAAEALSQRLDRSVALRGS